MFVLKKYPFAWSTLCYGIGIISASYFNTPFFVFSCLGILTLLLFFYLLFNKNSYLIFLGLITFFFVCGWLRMDFSESKNDLLTKLNFAGPDHQYTVVLKEIEKTEKYWKTTAETVDSIKSSARAICYFEINEGNELKKGMKVVFSAKPTRINDPQNPDEFDYASFLRHKRISRRFYIPKEQWKVRDYSPRSGITANIWVVKERLIHALASKLNGNTFFLVQALVLGEKKELDDDIKNAFSNTGARHILTVSGMHVGILMLILDSFLSLLLGRGRFSRKLIIPLIIPFIWGYAILTGAAPAVLRASFMLTAFLLGKMINRPYFSYNSLFVSIFLLLLIDPFLIYDIGFQFSYTAMLSIMIFFPYFNRFLKVENRILKYFWQLTVLSISAQILIMPLSTFYFHKIPLLFIFSSVFATIFAFLIFLLTIAFYLDFFTIGIMNAFIARILEHTSSLFLDIISWMDNLSFGTLEAIYLSRIQLLLLLALGVSLFFALYFNKKWTFYFSLICINIFFVEKNIRMSLPSENQLCFYSDKYNNRIDIFLDNICYTVVEDDLLNISPAYCNSNHRIKMQVLNTVPLFGEEYVDTISNGLMYFETSGLKMAILNSKNSNIYTCNTIDYLFIMTDDHTSIQEVLNSLEVKFIILPKTLKTKTVKAIKNVFDLPIWEIKEEGAFILNL